MKKALIWIWIILLSPILLFLIIIGLLYMPPVQNYIVQKVTAYVSETTGADISVGEVTLAFPLDLSINDVKFIQPDDSLPQKKDTIADIRQIIADVQLRPLFSSKVVIERMEINDAKINTANFVAAAKVKGSIGKFSLTSRGIDLNEESVMIDDVKLTKANVDVQLCNSVPEDTTTSENRWVIKLSTLDIAGTEVTLHMPGDTLQVYAFLNKAHADNGLFDLGKQLYQIDNLNIGDSKVEYDNNFEPRTEGLDYNHIALSGINIDINSILYNAPNAKLNLKNFQCREKSGIKVTQFSGNVSMDSTKLSLPNLKLMTSDSYISAKCTMDMNVTDSINPGKVYIRMLASLGKQDIMRFADMMPEGLANNYPEYPFRIKLTADGNMERVDITEAEADLPTAFNASAKGFAINPTDIDNLQASMNIDAQTYNLNFVKALLPEDTRKSFAIPYGIKFNAALKADRQRYSADIKLSEGKSTITAKGNFNASTESYDMKLNVNELNLRRFMPEDSLKTFSLTAEAEGQGFDFLSKRTKMKASAILEEFGYDSYNINNVVAEANVQDGTGHFSVSSDNEMMDGSVTLDALMSKKRIQATLGTDLRWIDLQMMRVTERPLVASVCAHVDMASDMKQSHKLQALVNDFTIRGEKKTYRPAGLIVDALTDRDTTWAKVSSGNLALNFHATGGYEGILGQFNKIMAELERQSEEKIIDTDTIGRLMPTMELHLKSGKENPFANFLRTYGVDFDELSFDLRTSPKRGVGGRGYIYSLLADSMQLDTIMFALRQDSSRVNFIARVENNKKNPQFVFKSRFNGYFAGKEIGLNAKYYDAKDKLGVSIGVKAEKCDSGINVHLTPYESVLGYKVFRLNHDNYIFLGRDNRIRADIDLIADDGTGVMVSSEENDPEMLQDLTVSLNRFNLGEITSALPYVPDIDGLLNGDYHVIQDKDERISVASDMAINELVYENNPIGNISSEFVYLQRDNDTHAVEARFSLNGKEIGVLNGSYRNEEDGYLDAKFNLMRMPLMLANGFIPDQLIGFEGYGSGELAVIGPPSTPKIDGVVNLDSCYIKSVPYGIKMRFNDTPVPIENSRLMLKEFKMYSTDNNTLTINGNVDFSDFEDMSMDIMMRARNYKIIDAKKSSKAVAYGKAFVNFMGRMNGGMSNLKMRGQLDVLGKTNMTYVLKDSPLSTDDKLKDLVTFTDFRDTTKVTKVSRPAIGGLDMQLMMNIESGARIMCALNADMSNYVNLEGGGELRMEYDDVDGLQLFGRYTLNDGEMKYAMPVIPLKTFQIEEGSYIEFTGDIMNPRLNMAASEEVKALVSSESSGSRSVLFQCGVKVTKTLKDMGLEFTLEAPEDMTVKNELAAMSSEERGRLAVTMLTTGMYLSDDNSSSLSMNNALNTFLQSEINSITNSAMKTFDISLGLDQNSDAAGNQYTDYSFKFAKRFWNNRVNLVIGGKVSGGNNSTTSSTSGETIIDNASLEYRIDQTAMRYVRLFYNKNTRDILEDNISEYGLGFVWRKKMNKFSELFNFRTKTNMNMPPVQPDSVSAEGKNITTRTDTLKTNEKNKQ